MPTVVKTRPSDAHRWLHCTASPGFIENVRSEIPEEDTPEYTQEGTYAHELAAKVLEAYKSTNAYEVDPHKHCEELAGEEHDDDMKRYVAGYVRYVLENISSIEDILIIETPVTVSYSGRKGYVDCAIISEDKLHIIDLKYGMGVSVQAEENPQLTTYAAELLKMLERNGKLVVTDSTTVELTIYQPRVIGEKAIRTWVTEADLLLEWYAGFICDTAEKIHADPFRQEFNPSEETCRFCEASALCLHRAAWLLEGTIEPEVSPTRESVTTAVSNFEMKPVDHLTREDLALILQKGSEIKKWLDKVHAMCYAMANSGEHIPGFKLVQGKANRVWVDEVFAEEFLRKYLNRSLLYSERFASPAQAEKLLLKHMKRKGKALAQELEVYYDKPIGNPSLVSDSDPRPALDVKPVDVNDEFEDESDSIDDSLL